MILLCLGLLCQPSPEPPPRYIYVPEEAFTVPPIPKIPKIGGRPVQVFTLPSQSPPERQTDPQDK